MIGGRENAASLSPRSGTRIATSDFAEEAFPHVLVAWQIGTAENMVRNTIGFPHYQGKSLLPALITLWPASQKQMVQPVGNGDYAFEIVVASLSVLGRGAVLVFGPQQVFGKNPSITQRQAEALSPRRITRPCGISNQDETPSTGVLNPIFRHIEGCQGADRPGAGVSFGCHSGSLALCDKARDIATPLKASHLEFVHQVGSNLACGLWK